MVITIMMMITITIIMMMMIKKKKMMIKKKMMMMIISNLLQVSFPGQLEHLGLQFAKCWTSGDHNMIEHHGLEDMTMMMRRRMMRMMMMMMRAEMIWMRMRAPVYQVTIMGFITVGNLRKILTVKD